MFRAVTPMCMQGFSPGSIIRCLPHIHCQISKLSNFSRIIHSMPSLDIAEVPKRPATLLQQWLDEAAKADVPLPTAASLATAHLPTGRVSNRMVNISKVDENGHIVIYSDFTHSKKGRDLQTNQHVASTFYWQKLDRSVRVEGWSRFMTVADSASYFKSRSKEFQASVLMGEQSQPVKDREELVKKYEVWLKTPESELEIPSYWFGAKLVPDWVEFYQGSSDRVSDRIAYSLDQTRWRVQRISP